MHARSDRALIFSERVYIVTVADLEQILGMLAERLQSTWVVFGRWEKTRQPRGILPRRSVEVTMLPAAPLLQHFQRVLELHHVPDIYIVHLYFIYIQIFAIKEPRGLKAEQEICIQIKPFFGGFI